MTSEQDQTGPYKDGVHGGLPEVCAFAFQTAPLFQDQPEDLRTMSEGV